MVAEPAPSPGPAARPLDGSPAVADPLPDAALHRTDPLPAAAARHPCRLKRPQSVLVVIFTAAGEYLLLHRVRPARFWQSVTGSLEPGESPRSAALRELREETGLLGAAGLVDLRQSRLFPIIPAWRARYPAGACFNREYWFALWLPTRRLVRLAPDEHRAYCWLSRDAALARVWSWTNRDAIRLCAARFAPARIAVAVP